MHTRQENVAAEQTLRTAGVDSYVILADCKPIIACPSAMREYPAACDTLEEAVNRVPFQAPWGPNAHIVIYNTTTDEVYDVHKTLNGKCFKHYPPRWYCGRRP